MLLAINGGTPVSCKPWPRWPYAGEVGRKLVAQVLDSNRWSISGPFSDTETLDQRASCAFANFCGVDFAYTTDHGSSALVAALLALDVGAGDEVILPGLTWVACASAVLRVNAIPVPVDVDPHTLCLDPAATARAVNTRTRAIMPVHLYGSMADMDALSKLARSKGLALIEDSAQAHGAEWNGARAGSIGDIGVFSFHQGKPMAAGEGGMVVTSEPGLARKLEQIRSDGRRYGRAPIGHQHLQNVGEVQGFNFCMPELQAALVLDALDRIDAENVVRGINAQALDKKLSAEFWRPIGAYASNRRRTYYHYAIAFDLDAFAGISASQIAAAVEAELGTPVTTPYPAMRDFQLLKPDIYPGWRRTRWPARTHKSAWPMPHARAASAGTLLLHHSVLLCEEDRLDEIAEAFAKVATHMDELRDSAQTR